LQIRGKSEAGVMILTSNSLKNQTQTKPLIIKRLKTNKGSNFPYIKSGYIIL